ncbi:glutamate cyclase domain-containing protein [uncultured Alsobacter sp.]|uniref:glutamate cyclase domain-containing protein n=1 Tax=uncultured Alsobacter sp. TaxID=1748258 RepID=UPI0025FA5522|nr:glutamate cyclase domain-containing protein [uncultured Alsobacter sp.]
MPDIIGEAVDQLITIEVKNRGGPHGILRPLYEAARRLAGGRPLTAVIAERLRERIKPGDTVFLVTGAGYLPTMPKGESDGPPGAAALGRVLYKGLGAVPVFVVEPNHVDVMEACARAAGLGLRSFAHARDQRLGAAIVSPPPEQAAVAAWIDHCVAEMRPAAVIGVERLAPGKDGAIYAAKGLPLSGPNAINEGLIDMSGIMPAAARTGALTIGIGDHGNELGFGAIYDTVVATMPHGDRIATTVAADLVLPAMNSNWGSYGVEACLAFLLGRADLMHAPDMEERILRRAFEAGVLEAMAFSGEFLVDGLDGETSVSVVQFLGNIVRKNLEKPVGYAGR